MRDLIGDMKENHPSIEAVEYHFGTRVSLWASRVARDEWKVTWDMGETVMYV